MRKRTGTVTAECGSGARMAMPYHPCLRVALLNLAPPAFVTLIVVVLSFALLRPTGAFAADATPSREQQIKAAFLYNFTKFIEWPARSFSGARAAIVIGVLGNSPPAGVLAAALEQVVKDRSVNGRGVVVRRIDTAEEASAAHLLFVPVSEEARFGQIRSAIQGRPVLTVGESSSFARLGGAINFVVEGDKVRFEISTGPAERSGLRISAQLQKLARLVRAEAPSQDLTAVGAQGSNNATPTTPQ